MTLWQPRTSTTLAALCLVASVWLVGLQAHAQPTAAPTPAATSSFAATATAASASASASAKSNFAKPPSFAFFYGKDIPWESLGAFDIAVVEPGHTKPLTTGPAWSHRLNPRTQVAAYISVGEVHPTREYFKRMQSAWKLGENKDWGSIVVDQAAPGFKEFYIAEVIKPLWAQGYRAFFLDTLDSFYLVAKTPEARAQQIEGMATLIRAIKAAYPDAKLIFNRGFEILPQVNKDVFAVVAESLFQGWDAGKKEFREVPQADRDWLWGQLKKCKDEYGLHIVSIDYVAPKNRKLARETAAKIRALGAVPWVTNPELNMLGVGHVEVLPRQVLAVHDEEGHYGKLAVNPIHSMATMPLNHLGLDVRNVLHSGGELAQINSQPLLGRYAGVVMWFAKGVFPGSADVRALVQSAQDQGVPLVIVGDLPDDAQQLASLGLTMGTPEKTSQALRMDKRSVHIGAEIEPSTSPSNFAPMTANDSQVWLRAYAPSGSFSDGVAITPWGGYALANYWLVDLSRDNGSRWVVDPIAFFRSALRRLDDVPVPDVTTENGKRLLMVHHDGDGFASRAEVQGTPLASEVMLSEFLQRYRVPTTVSVIEGELAPKGLYAALSPALEAAARKMFALPHVEIATHSLSHPFFWAELELGVPVQGRYPILPVPGYAYSPEREIKGSADYINQRLAPPGKTTKMMLWTGNTHPLATPVRIAYEAGLLNLNAGDTWITKAEPSLSLVGPLGMMKGDYFQVYAPNQNENVYTKGWTGPFYGYERVIETFEMTDAPRRLKPINIYYHTYIATKRAGIASLHKVYQWALASDPHPVFASEYAQRVLDWRRATVATSPDGFELRSGQHLRQWRVGDTSAALATTAATALPDLDMQRSSAIAGWHAHGSARYVHAAADVATLVVGNASTKTGSAWLDSANAKLSAWQTSNTAVRAEFDGYLPLRARIHAPRCDIDAAASTAGLRAQRSAAFLNIEGTSLGKTQLVLRCAG